MERRTIAPLMAALVLLLNLGGQDVLRTWLDQGITGTTILDQPWIASGDAPPRRSG